MYMRTLLMIGLWFFPMVGWAETEIEEPFGRGELTVIPPLHLHIGPGEAAVGFTLGSENIGVNDFSTYGAGIHCAVGHHSLYLWGGWENQADTPVIAATLRGLEDRVGYFLQTEALPWHHWTGFARLNVDYQFVREILSAGGEVECSRHDGQICGAGPALGLHYHESMISFALLFARGSEDSHHRDDLVVIPTFNFIGELQL